MIRLLAIFPLFFSLILFLFWSVTVDASTTPEQQAKSIKLRPVKAYSALDNHIVKIGVFYTSDLLDEFTIEEINRYVMEQINAANIVMENSGLAIRRELGYLGVHPIENEPSELIEVFLSRIRGSEGSENRVIAAQYGLDYVTVVRPMNDNRFCGWAYYGDPYAILQMGGRCTSNTLAAHEWGHNDGADHDIANSSAQPLRAYGHGYFCGGEGTIMSSPSGNKWNTRHNFYSSPDLSAGGDTCGLQDTANVVRMLNELKDNPFQMGNRKSDPVSLAFVQFSPEQPLLVNESDGILPITIELVDAQGELTTLGQSASVEVITGGLSAKANTNNVTNDYQGIAQHIIFQPGENSVTVNLTLESDSISEADETLQLNLRQGDVVSVLTPELEITITENMIVTPTLVEFVQTERIVLSAGQSQSISLSRSGNTESEFTAHLAMTNDILTLSSDQIIFSKGQTEASINVTAHQAIKGETSTIEFTNDASQIGQNSSLEVYVLADEVISFDTNSELSVNAGDTISFNLQRTGELLTAFDVEVEFSDSWMTLNTSNNNVIHFNAEQTSKSFSVSIAADSFSQLGTVTLKLASDNQGNIIERTVKVADKVVVPPDNNGNNKPSSSGGSIAWLLLFSLCVLTKHRSKSA